MKLRPKTLLLWFGLPLALLAAIFVFRAGILAICFYAIALLIAASRVMALFWLRPLRVEREVSADVVEIGEAVNVVVKLTNPSPWPILWLYAEESLPPRMARRGTTRRLLYLPPRRSFFLHYSLTPDRRGCHQLGPLVVESGDVFGLFKRSHVHERRDFVTAVPHYHVIEEYEVGRRRSLGDLTAERSIFEDTTSIRGIREYRRGDAMKRIHWKSTARTGRLCTKIYDPVVEAGATVILDFHRERWRDLRAYELEDLPPEIAVQLACTICRYLADGGWKIGLFSNGRDPLGMPGVTLAQARSTDTLSEALTAARAGHADDRLEPVSVRASRRGEQFSIIRENLGRIELSDGLPIENVLMHELAYIDRTQALVFIAGHVTDELIAGIVRARELGYRIMVFVVCNPEGHDRAFETLLAHGVEVYRMDQRWRLKEIATGRRFI